MACPKFQDADLPAPAATTMLVASRMSDAISVGEHATWMSAEPVRRVKEGSWNGETERQRSAPCRDRRAPRALPNASPWSSPVRSTSSLSEWSLEEEEQEEQEEEEEEEEDDEELARACWAPASARSPALPVRALSVSLSDASAIVDTENVEQKR